MNNLFHIRKHELNMAWCHACHVVIYLPMKDQRILGLSFYCMMHNKIRGQFQYYKMVTKFLFLINNFKILYSKDEYESSIS